MGKGGTLKKLMMETDKIFYLLHVQLPRLYQLTSTRFDETILIGMYIEIFQENFYLA